MTNTNDTQQLSQLGLSQDHQNKLTKLANDRGVSSNELLKTIIQEHLSQNENQQSQSQGIKGTNPANSKR